MDIEINVALFERMMKNIILLEYDSVIPREKKLDIKRKKIITDDDNLNEHNFQAEIVREIFKVLINVTCIKKVKIHDQEVEIKYGEYLNNGLVEYYTFLVCKKYSAEYTKNKKYISNFEFVKDLSEEFDLDTLIFNSNAIEIFEKIQSKELEAKYDWIEIGEYFNSHESFEKDIDSNNISENDLLLYLVYSNGNMHFKYYDNTVHTIDFNNNECDKVFNIYRDLAFNDKLNVSNFISKLERMGISYNIIHEEKSRKDIFEYNYSDYTDKNITSDNSNCKTEENNIHLNDEDTTSLDEVISEIEEKLESEEYLETENEDSITVNDIIDELKVQNNRNDSDENIEVETSSNYDNVLDQKNNSTDNDDLNKNYKEAINPENIISEAEYEALCMKAIKKKGLTPEEFELMEAFDRYYYGDSNDSFKTKNTDHSTKKEKNKVEKLEIEDKKATEDSNKEESFLTELKKSIGDSVEENEQGDKIKLNISNSKNKSSFIKKAIILILSTIFVVSVGIILGAVLFKMTA